MQCLDHCEAQHLFEVVFPAMVDLALRAPTLCTMVSTALALFQFVQPLPAPTPLPHTHGVCEVAGGKSQWSQF